MYCTTFYSYKGGVGRTLALANVAVRLAMRGKRVLIVDFDLEAPGITTLDFCDTLEASPGIVDYILEYLKTGRAPEATDFIHHCHFFDPEHESQIPVDVMPAGAQTESYGAKFAQIDWRELYQEKEGFLLMEDLRQQWANLGYDYVLIDSRTGLTDVSGICTRQLPDGVVTLFFPNEQNLVGLTEMVKSIRSTTARPRKPELVFVASRLPKLDDENGVLERWLARFKEGLGYSKQQFCQLDQYDSLALLDQAIFVLNRPKTGLAKQYRALSGLVAQLNNDDAQGSLDYVKAVIRMYSAKSREGKVLGDESNPFSLVKEIRRLLEIEDRHKNDYVIQRYLAEHYFSLRDFSRLEVVLQNGLAAGLSTSVEYDIPAETVPRLHQLQMRMSSETGEGSIAVEAALDLLRCTAANESMVVEALMILVTFDSESLPQPSEIPFFQNANAQSLYQVMGKFGISAREATYNCRIALYIMGRFGQDIPTENRSRIGLALIAGGEFDQALALLGDSHDLMDIDEADVAEAFNRVMALWGRDGAPDMTLFPPLLRRAKAREIENQGNANYQQCLALIYAVLGDVAECSGHLANAKELVSGREVSCWSFVGEPEDEFQSHCEEIHALASGDPIVPLFVAQARKAALGRRLH